MKNNRWTAILYALAAGLFYAVNVPCSKLLLGHVAPTCMAGLLYIGAGLGVGTMYLFQRPQEPASERLRRADWPYAVGMVALDIVAPILLMLGVNLGTSANASLLGNFEIVATTLIALLLFREPVSKRLWAAIALITVASAILSFGGEGSLRFSTGSLLVLGATACWGLENNCTRSISEHSTHQIVTIKGLCSGAGAMLVSHVVGEPLPGARWIVPALLLGFVAYGLSIFTYIRAQRVLGAARTSAYYAVAPFIGALLSFLLLRERLSASYGIALAIMAAGTALIVRDTLLHRHAHPHAHVLAHTHGGVTHTHTVIHTHDHAHCLSEGRHGHTHTPEELERDLPDHFAKAGT